MAETATVSFRPTLRSQVTSPSEEKRLSSCHRSQRKSKGWTYFFGPAALKFSSVEASWELTIEELSDWSHPPDSSEEILISSVAVTGHKPRRVGRNDTVMAAWYHSTLPTGEAMYIRGSGHTSIIMGLAASPSEYFPLGLMTMFVRLKAAALRQFI